MKKCSSYSRRLAGSINRALLANSRSKIAPGLVRYYKTTGIQSDSSLRNSLSRALAADTGYVKRGVFQDQRRAVASSAVADDLDVSELTLGEHDTVSTKRSPSKQSHAAFSNSDSYVDARHLLKPDSQDVGNFENFEMDQELVSVLKKLGVSNLFPVQVATFNGVREGKDMIVRAKTGSGKTMAFVLPIVDRLLKAQRQRRPAGSPSAIVVAPTRELALQVQKEFARIAPFFNCVSVYGGTSVINQQRDLKGVVDIVVGTPGRMIDMIDRRSLLLNQVQTVVLDEADEMLKMGFKEDMDMIFDSLPEKSQRQTLMFSATVAPEIRKIAKDYLNNGQMVDLVGDDESGKIPSGIELISMMTPSGRRFDAIGAVLESYCAGTNKKALVFAPTKQMTMDLAQHDSVIDSGVKCLAMHGDMTQQHREQALAAFRGGSAQAMVATDVAARGLDIPQVDLIIHFSIPTDPDSFVHRTGRTGRAGRDGTNVLLTSIGESRELNQLEKFVGRSFFRRPVPGSYELGNKRNSELREKLQSVPAHESEAFSELACELIEAKLGKEAIDSLDDNTLKKIVNVLAASLKVAGGVDNVEDFSGLNGKPGLITLVLEDEKFTSKFKHLTSNPKGRLYGKDIRAIESLIEQEIENCLDMLGVEVESLARCRSRNRHNAFAQTPTISMCGRFILFDIHPKVARLLTDARSTEDGDQSKFLRLAGNLPEFIQPEDPSEFNTRGGYGRRDNRGGRGGFSMDRNGGGSYGYKGGNSRNGGNRDRGHRGEGYQRGNGGEGYQRGNGGGRQNRNRQNNRNDYW